MPEEPYVGSEPLSFLRDARGLVQTEIDKRHGQCHAFISTYGFQPVGLWWLERMQSVLNQMVVTALFGIVEGTAREHLRRSGAYLHELHGWGQVRHAFEKTFKCKIDQVEGYPALKRARLLATFFKHTGAKSLRELVNAWPICGDIVDNKSEQGALQMWAGLPVGDLIEGVAQFLKELQSVVDRSA